MSGRLQDKVAIITGAASGQGAMETKIFLQEGAKVIATDIQNDLLTKKDAELRKEFGDNLLSITSDVTSEDAWVNIVKQAVDKFGKIDILVNNAGIGTTDKTSGLTDSTVEDWYRYMNTNAMAHFLGMKHVVPYMKKNGQGAIIDISSLASVRGLQEHPLTLLQRVLHGPLLRVPLVTLGNTIFGLIQSYLAGLLPQ